jgi:hypothetical protein
VGLRRFLMLLSAGLVIVLLVVVWFFPSNDDFQAENPFWNGTKDMSSVVPASPLADLSALPSSPWGSTLILVPYLDFAPAELEGLRAFVDGGGTLVLADDYGYGNEVLEYLGLGVRFSGQVLLDPLFNYKNGWLPKVTHLASSSITTDTESLIFNHATCLTDVEEDDILASSSSFSFLDLNGNQVWDEDELAGPLPVISRHSLGSGQLILISDPSVFINSMDEVGSNRVLVQNIAAITTAELLIDQSHLPPSSLAQTKDLLAYVRGFLSTPAVTAGLVAVVLAVVLIPVWHRRKSGGE